MTQACAEQSNDVGEGTRKTYEEPFKELSLFNFEIRRLTEDLNASYLKRCCREVHVSIFSQVTSDKLRGNSVKLHQ